MPEPFSLYVHIPFCTAKCTYCAFNSYAGQGSLMTPYAEAVRREAALWTAPMAGRKVDTAFLGGGTPLTRDVDSGRVEGPDLDLQADMYEWPGPRLAEAGYRQYENSNWARSGRECRHNQVYWRNGDWLGLGAGAHSHLFGERFAHG